MTQLLEQQLGRLILGTGSCLWCGQPGITCCMGCCSSQPSCTLTCVHKFIAVTKRIIYSCKCVKLSAWKSRFSWGQSTLSMHACTCIGFLFPFPHTVLSVEENRQWKKSHVVSPQPVLAGWLRLEAAAVCGGPQTQIYPKWSQLSADPPQDLLYCFSAPDHEVVDLSCSLFPPAACCASTSCWANTPCLLFIAYAIYLYRYLS